MSGNPKRPWFRFHLATAVAMLMVMALFGLLNLQGRTHYRYIDQLGSNPLKFKVYGWPIDVSYEVSYEGPTTLGTGDKQVKVTVDDRRIHIEYPEGERNFQKYKASHVFNYTVVMEDIATALASVLATAVLFETILRRRESPT